MRFERVRIDGFGPLEGLDTGPPPLPGLVVVHGPNEAGKTSFFHFLTALLYGFYPASRDGHPWAPWHGPEMGGAAWIRLATGEGLEVRRRLRSTPWGRLTRGGTEEELDNRTLPLAEHLPLDTFRQVFALTLDELAELERDRWAEVQDRLVGAMGTRDLRPPREVAAELESEAGSLWRPNRRGNQEVRERTRRIAELRARRGEAREADESLRGLVHERDAARRSLEEARQEREALRQHQERVERLLPVHRQLQRIEALEAEAGPAAPLRGLPSDPTERLRELSERTRERRRRLEDLRALAERVREEDRRWSGLARELFPRPDDPGLEEALRAVDPREVRSAVVELERARDDRRMAEAAAAAPITAPRPPGLELPVWTAPAVLGGGALLTLVGLGLAAPWITWTGGLLLAVGAILLLRARRARRSGAPVPVPGGGEAAAAAARDREARARRLFLAAVEPLELRPDVADRPTLELPSRIERLREILADRRAREATLAELDLPGPEERPAPADPDADEGQLGLFPGAREPAAGAPGSGPDEEAPADRLERAAAAAETAWAASREELVGLRDRLSLLGGGDPGEGARRALARMEARRTAAELRRELEADHPHDLEERVAEVTAAREAGEEWTADPDAGRTLRGRDRRLSERVTSLTGQIEKLEERIRHLGDRVTVDDLDGAILVEEEERAERGRERDRKALLARVVLEADRRFREERMPRVLARAGSYLDTITGGRYGAIRTGATPGDAEFYLEGPGYPHALRVGEPVSTGTREQVWLALRLAVVDHLDPGEEPLPLFIDEGFVNWDRQRRERGVTLLAEIARRRQVFVFTCHGPVVDALEERGARRIELAASETAASGPAAGTAPP